MAASAVLGLSSALLLACAGGQDVGSSGPGGSAPRPLPIPQFDGGSSPQPAPGSPIPPGGGGKGDQPGQPSHPDAGAPKLPKLPPPDAWVPPPPPRDLGAPPPPPPPTTPPPPQVQGWGGTCTTNADCDRNAGFACLVASGAPRGFCSRGCFMLGDICGGTPMANLAACVYNTSVGNFCGFLCRTSDGTKFACPGRMACDPLDNPPGTGQHHCYMP